jgi:hypothetical protein
MAVLLDPSIAASASALERWAVRRLDGVVAMPDHDDDPGMDRLSAVYERVIAGSGNDAEPILHARLAAGQRPAI